MAALVRGACSAHGPLVGQPSHPGSRTLSNAGGRVARGAPVIVLPLVCPRIAGIVGPGQRAVARWLRSISCSSPCCGGGLLTIAVPPRSSPVPGDQAIVAALAGGDAKSDPPALAPASRRSSSAAGSSDEPLAGPLSANVPRALRRLLLASSSPACRPAARATVRGIRATAGAMLAPRVGSLPSPSASSCSSSVVLESGRGDRLPLRVLLIKCALVLAVRAPLPPVTASWANLRGTSRAASRRRSRRRGPPRSLLPALGRVSRALRCPPPPRELCSLAVASSSWRTVSAHLGCSFSLTQYCTPLPPPMSDLHVRSRLSFGTVVLPAVLRFRPCPPPASEYRSKGVSWRRSDAIPHS